MYVSRLVGVLSFSRNHQLTFEKIDAQPFLTNSNFCNEVEFDKVWQSFQQSLAWPPTPRRTPWWIGRSGWMLLELPRGMGRVP